MSAPGKAKRWTPSEKALFARQQQMSRQAGVIVSYCRNTGMSSKATYRLLTAAMDFRGGIQQFEATYENFGGHMLGRDRSSSACKSAVSRDVATHTAERESSGYPGIKIIPGGREIDRHTGETISATPATWEIEAFPYLVKMLEIARNLEREKRRLPKAERTKREALYDEAFKLADVPRVEVAAPAATSDGSPDTSAEETESVEGYKLAVQRVVAYARSARLKLIKEAARQRADGEDATDLEATERATCNLLHERIDFIFSLPPDQLKHKLSEDEPLLVHTLPVNKNSRTSLAEDEDLPEPENLNSGVENATAHGGFCLEKCEVLYQSGDGLEQANAALTILSSLGVEKINVLFCDDAKQEKLIAERERLRFQGLDPKEIRAQGINPQDAVKTEVTTLTRLRAKLAEKMDYCAARQWSFIVDPRPSLGARLIQVDECGEEAFKLLSDFAAYGINTSDGNGQAEIVLPEGYTNEQCDEIEDRLFTVLKPLGCNKGSSGASRWPGSFNFKSKRRRTDGSFPMVTLRIFNPSRITTREELEGAGLQPELKKPEPEQQQPRKLSRLPYAWPDYDYNLAAADRSGADWKFTCAAKKMGWLSHHIKDRLMLLSDKAQQRGSRYVDRTVNRAAPSDTRATHGGTL
jgi:hypothetical protein